MEEDQITHCSLLDADQLQGYLSRPVWYRHSLRNGLMNPLESLLLSLLLLGRTEDSAVAEKTGDEGEEEDPDAYMYGNTTLTGKRFDVLLIMKFAQSFVLDAKVEDWGLKLCPYEAPDSRHTCSRTDARPPHSWCISTYSPKEYLTMPVPNTLIRALGVGNYGKMDARSEMIHTLAPLIFSQQLPRSKVSEGQGKLCTRYFEAGANGGEVDIVPIMIALGHVKTLVDYHVETQQLTGVEVGSKILGNTSRQVLLLWIQCAVVGQQADIFVWLTSQFLALGHGPWVTKEVDTLMSLAEQVPSPVFLNWCLQNGSQVPPVKPLLTAKKASVKVLKLLLQSGATVDAEDFITILDQGDRSLGYSLFRTCYDCYYEQQTRLGFVEPLDWTKLLLWGVSTTATLDLIMLLFELSKKEALWLSEGDSSAVPAEVRSKLRPIDVNFQFYTNLLKRTAPRGGGGYVPPNSYHIDYKCLEYMPVDPDGMTALEVAVVMYNFDHGDGEAVITLLLDKGADPFQSKDEGKKAASSGAKLRGAMQLAVLEHRQQALELMLKRGADPNMKVPPLSNGNNQTTLLHTAAHTGRSELYDLLLQYGADENLTDAKGEKPQRREIFC